MRRLASLVLPLPVLGMLALVTATSFLGAHAASPPHIMVIVDENAAYNSSLGSPFIIGSSKAPYINSLATTYVSATNWFAVRHTSQFAYRELISGDNPQHVPLKGKTLVDELAGAGISWKAYIEDAPSPNCANESKDVGEYAAGHNPFSQFASILNSKSQCDNVVPYSQTLLNTDLNGSSPPDFVWITPNQCDDMHTTCTSGKVQQGDDWLKTNLPTVLNSSWFASNGVVILTWDESVTKDTSGGTFGDGGHIATIVISNAGTGEGHFTASGDHYATLRGIEEAYGVGLLGNSANASFGDLLPAFHLP